MQIVLVIGIMLFLLLFSYLVYSFVSSIKMAADPRLCYVAAAGDVKRDTPLSRSLVIDYQCSKQKDEIRLLLNDKKYDSLVVSGYSMLLADIRSNNIVLVNKDNKLTRETKFPCVVALERDKKALQRAAEENDFARYKLRRAWKICSILECQDSSYLDSILSCEKFKELNSDHMEFFMTHNEMKKDFMEYRMNKYKNDYPNCEDASSPYHQVVISTTLHANPLTRHPETYNKVTFSIHPLVLVKGIVEKAITTETN